jgi:hypothetical protein
MMEDVLRLSAQLGCMLADLVTSLLRPASGLDLKQPNLRRILDERWLKSFREEFQLLAEKES